jgi:hypothetical protein
MKKRSDRRSVWVAVKVVRGYVAEARLFTSLGRAERTERRWRVKLNPDYDEVAVVSARFDRSK